MREHLKTLALDSKEELIQKLRIAGYPFAAWKMPHESNYQLIISLCEIDQVTPEMRGLGKGFVINRFSDNHPGKPYFISADIIIEENDVQIDPKVNDSQLDELIQKLDSPSEEDFESPNDYAGEADVPKQNYENNVALAVDKIRNGDFEKVVLSRYKDVKLTKPINCWDFFTHIGTNYSGSFCSITHIPGHGLWIGATPELLLSDSKESFKTIALAGTKVLQPDQHLSEIAWTQKEIEEQALVSRYIINCFKKIRLREFHEHGPKTVQAGSLTHLKTEFEVLYNEVSFDGLGEQMLDLLHPTSAVCGMPIEKTQPWIEQVEGYDREFYAGFLGPVEFNDSIDLFVNLRCMKIEGTKVRFYAGAGITEDSIPAKEFEETEMKMNVLMSKLP